MWLPDNSKSHDTNARAGWYERHFPSASSALPVPKRGQNASSSPIGSEASLPLVIGGLIGARTGTLRSTWLLADRCPPDVERELYSERRQTTTFQIASTRAMAWAHLQCSAVTAPARRETRTSNVHVRTDSVLRDCETPKAQKNSPPAPVSDRPPTFDDEFWASEGSSSSDSVPLALSAPQSGSHATSVGRSNSMQGSISKAIETRKRSAMPLKQNERLTKRRRARSDDDYRDDTTSSENDDGRPSDCEDNGNFRSGIRVTRSQAKRGSWQLATYQSDRPRRRNVQYGGL